MLRAGLPRRVRNTAGFLPDQRGASAVEFVLVMPILFLILFGIIKFGIAMNAFIQMADGTRTGSRMFAISRTTSAPWTNTKEAVWRSAANLHRSDLSVDLYVNGVPCSGDQDCMLKLTPALGGTAQVKASYPCDLKIMGFDFAPDCFLRTQTTERIE